MAALVDVSRTRRSHCVRHMALSWAFSIEIYGPMITGFFLSIFYAIIAFFVGLLPVIAFPTAVTSAFTTIMGYVNALSFLLPVSTLLQVLGYAMIFHAAILGWRLVHLIGRYLRGR